MNIQIFGKPKCFDTRKAERYFKERKIKYQYIDLIRVGMSEGEYRNIARSVGGLRALLDERSRLYEELYIAYLAPEAAIEEKLLDNPGLFRTPIVRNGRLATIGYQPDVWKTWT